MLFADFVFGALRVNHCASAVFDKMDTIGHHTVIYLSHKGSTHKEIQEHMMILLRQGEEVCGWV